MHQRLLSRLRAVYIGLMAPVLGVAVLVAVFMCLTSPAVSAATSSNLNFQARLLGTNGTIVPDGNYNIDFKLYNADSTTGTVGTCNGACLWEEARKNSNAQGVQVINGYFSVNLGSVTSFPAINWDQQLWLTMNIGGTTTGASPTWDGEMQNAGHSIALTALPYSFIAGQLALTSGAHRGTLSFNTVATDPAIVLPDASGTLCLQTASACGFEATSGNDFIRNQTSVQSANFNIQSAGSGTIAGLIQGASGQSVDIFEVKANSVATPLLAVGSGGSATFRNQSDSTSAFQVQNSTGLNLFAADTINNLVGIISAPTNAPSNAVIQLASTASIQQTTVANALTVSGNEITDSSRTTNTQGDGRSSPDSSYSVWEGTINQILNGGSETNNNNITSNGSATVSRDTSIRKFGSASAKVITGGITAREGLIYNTGAATASSGQTWTGSVWLYQNSGSSKSMLIDLSWRDNSGAGLSDTESSVLTLPTNTWTRFSVTGTAPASTDRVYLKAYTSGTQVLTFWSDGGQLEQKAAATPYVETNGSAVLRGNARVQGSSSKLSATQGWISTRVRWGFASTQTSSLVTGGVNLRLMQWQLDTNNRILVILNSTNTIQLIRVSGGAGATITSAAQVFSAGNVATITAAWDASKVYLWINGTTVTAVANTNVPSGLPASFDIGTSAGGAGYIDSDILWFAAGTGTLSNADATAISNLGNADPDTTFFNSTDSVSSPSMVWKANSANYQDKLALSVQSSSGIGLLNIDAADLSVLLPNANSSASGLVLGRDADLYRSAANTLKTDGSFITAGNLTSSGNLSVNGSSLFQPSADSTSAFQIQNAAGTGLFIADTTNMKITSGISDSGTAVGFTLNTPNYTTSGAKLISLQNNGTEKFSVDKDGNVNIVSGAAYKINGSQISSANLSDASNIAYLNGTGPQTFTGDNKFTGTILSQNASNSTTAFQAQNSAGSDLVNVNTTDGYVINNGVADLGNILQNPGFEASGSGDSTGWYTPGANQAITNDPANARSGNYDLQVSANSSTHAVTTKYYAVKPGDQIYAEAYVKNSAGANGDAGIYIEYSDKDKGNATFTSLDTGLPGTGYVLKSTSQTIPANKFYVRIAASVKATATTGSFYFDDFYLKRINEQAPLLLTAASATAFQVQNASSQTVLGVDTSNTRIFTTIPDSGSAIGFTFNTPSYTSAGAKLLSLQNNLAEKFSIDKDGNISSAGGLSAGGDITTTGNANIGSGKVYKINGTQITSAALSNNSDLAKLSGTGPQAFSGNNEFDGTLLNKVASATAFQVQNAANAVFTVDTSGNKVILGTASALSGSLQFQGSGGAGTLTLAGPTSPNTGNFTLSIPAITASANVCTDNSVCSGYASSAGLSSGLAGKLNKGAVDTSSASVTAVQGNLYAFTNSSNNIASGILKLDNGNNTGNALTVTGTNNYGAGNAYIVVNDTNATPSGFLIDLQANASSEFNVDAAGNVGAAGNISIASGKQYQINGVQITSAALSDGNTLAKLAANQTFSGNNTFSSASNSFTGDGSGLTNLNATNVATGTLNDGRLSGNVALLNRTGQSFSGDNSFAPTSNNAGTTIKQTSGTATSGSVLDVQTADGLSHFLQITNAAANEGNVSLQSVGATRDLTLGSGSGTLKIAAATNTIQHSNSSLTIDINNGSDSTLSITNAQAGPVASLSVEGDIAVGASRVYKVGATSGASATCAGNSFSQNEVSNGGIVTSLSCANAVASISTAGGSIANGASISGNALTLGYADTSNPGLVSNAAQSFNGDKTFIGNTAIQKTSATAFQVQTAGGGSTLLTANTSALSVTVSGATVFGSNSYSSGSSSTITQSLIDNNTTVLAAATASGLTFTVPSPTTTTAGRLLYLSNNGSNAFIINYGTGSFSLNINSTVTLVWTGSAWTSAGADAGTLQTGYNNSPGGATPEVKLDSTRAGLDIQDADSSLNSSLLTVRNSNSGGLGASIFDIQSANPITDVTNNATNNLITNGSLETGATGWAKTGSAQVPVAQDTTKRYIGSASLKIATIATDTAGTDGAKYSLSTSTLVSNTQYSLSLYAKTDDGASMSTFEIGRADDGSTNTSCLTAQSLSGNGWTQLSCTFTTGTTANTPYIYVRQTDQAARTIYVDAVQLFRTSLISNQFADQTFAAGDWQAKGSASVIRDTTQNQAGAGTASVKVTVCISSCNNNGVKHNITLNDSTLYRLSFWALLDSGSTALSTMEAGYSSDGSTDNTVCITGQSVTTTWAQFSCSFSTPASHSGTPYFYVKELVGTIVKTFYLDSVSLSIGNPLGAYREGLIALNGVINSPVSLQNQSNSTTAFQIQNASGVNVLVLDSLNKQLRIYENNGSANYSLIYYDSATSTANYTASSGTVAVGTGAGAITVTAGSGAAVNITANAASSWKTNTGSLTLQSGSGTSDFLILNAGGSGQVQVNGSAVVKLGSATSDPTCTNGAIYYNTTTPQLRGCINGVWQNLASITPTLQTTYQSSTGSTTPEIKLNTGTGNTGGVDIQDADTTIAGVLFAVRKTNAAGLGTSMFNVDTSNNSVNIGSSSGHSTNPIILVLDNYSNSGADPTTTINGSMYYNGTKNKFRCYENGAWVDCLNGPAENTTTFNGTWAATAAKSAANIIYLTPIYVSGQLTVNEIRVDVTTILGAAGDVGVYDSSGNLVINGGSSSLTTGTGFKTITPTQSNKILEAGQYYAAVTWNSTTGAVAGNTILSGQIKHVGTLATGGLVLPSTITISSISIGTIVPGITINN